MSKPIAGAILAGGASRRFGGDKALAAFRGRRLIDWAADTLRPYCSVIYLAGRIEEGFEHAPDRPKTNMGPLAGIAGSMARARNDGFAQLITLPCDTPLVSAALISRIVQAPGHIFLSSCPVIGSWRTDDCDRLEAWLEAGWDLSVRRWTDFCGAEAIDDLGPIPNINFRCDLERLEASDG